MKDFRFSNPTKLIVGRDTVQNIGKELKKDNIKKVIMLYGKGSIFKNGVYDATIKSLKDNNIEYVEVSGIKPNPVLSKVEEALEISKKEQIDGVLAVGGGSVIDSAKALSAAYYIKGEVWDIFEKREKVEKALPVYTILTISATATEMNGNFVITNEKEDKKWGFFSPLVYPHTSIIDPTVQFTLPKNQVANGFVDTLTHTFEYYFDGTQNNDITDEISEGIIRTVIKNSKPILDNPKDYNARLNFIWCSTLALNGMTGVGKTGEFSMHMIEHSLSAFYDIAHGEGLSIIGLAWMKYCYKNDLKKFESFAEKVFNINSGTAEEKALKGIEKLKEYYKEIGEPVTLKEIGVKKDEFRKIAENVALRYIPLGNMKILEIDDIVEILKIAYE